jgi:hypothetical protein
MFGTRNAVSFSIMWQFMRLARLARDEGTRHPVTADYRYNFGYFALVPVGLMVGIQLGHSLLGKSHPGVAGLVLAAVGTSFYFGSLLWARLVPAAVSLLLGLTVWTVMFWLNWHSLF